jgi:hypothetical protein
LRSQGWPEPESGREVEQFTRALQWTVLEMAHLSDGRALLLRDPLGWLVGPSRGSAADVWAYLDVQAITRNVLNVVLPDDAERTGDEHSWDLFARTLAAQGVTAGVEDLRAVPYLVVLAPRVDERVTGQARPRASG